MSVSSLKRVVFDIDGVLLRGGRLIPGAAEAVRKLAVHKIPFVFVTNGGGMLEAEKAADLTKKLGLLVAAEQVALCHSPMQMLAKRFADSRILVLGGEPRCLEVARAYGFRNALSITDMHNRYPNVYPLRQPPNPTPLPSPSPSPSPPLSSTVVEVDAVMVFHDPVDWGLEMQLLCDVLRPTPPPTTTTTTPTPTPTPAPTTYTPTLTTASGARAGADVEASRVPWGSLQNLGHIPLFVSNNDLQYTTEYPIPRLTQGAFTLALSALYKSLYGRDLTVQYCGKPFGVQYRHAEVMLDTQALSYSVGDSSSSSTSANSSASSSASSGAQAVYFGIGDNPKSDIRGANGAGPHWRSVLVRTGIFDGAENDAEDPADFVCADVAAAVDLIIEYES
ncbi:HAD-like domain-containing protein [Ochromonadaceae sp. CCMP2298]|nr:HAD-like domain-containing protein [Ochromonadaceae sp. CCMP2298]|mmetsp:Transcript_32639/g.72652  ORF Transcript_32639/g.72652 Transcript_32639/m.72652 type:complete len:392 (-) Transcript_32639:65-1240(-)